VSLSHSGPHVVLAVANVAVGVDVQIVAHDVDLGQLADLVLTTDESLYLREAPPHRRNHAFTRIWTRKEAVLKATGDGLRHPLTQVDIAGLKEAGRTVSWLTCSKPGQDLQVRDLVQYEEVPASVATLGSPLPLVREQEWPLTKVIEQGSIPFGAGRL
jgi:4'-phosphopantetheinyl transferase